MIINQNVEKNGFQAQFAIHTPKPAVETSEEAEWLPRSDHSRITRKIANRTRLFFSFWPYLMIVQSLTVPFQHALL